MTAELKICFTHIWIFKIIPDRQGHFGNSFHHKIIGKQILRTEYKLFFVYYDLGCHNKTCYSPGMGLYIPYCFSEIFFPLFDHWPEFWTAIQFQIHLKKFSANIATETLLPNTTAMRGKWPCKPRWLPHSGFSYAPHRVLST